MKDLLASALLVAAATATPPAAASLALAEQKQCLQCHSVDADTIGPSLRKVGAIYRTMKDAEPKLVEAMRLGSDAHLGPMWGRARMPDTSERPAISDQEARQLARWILSLP